MRYLTFILLITCSIAAYSSPPIRVISHTTISTDNWYPLSEQEMKAAAVDAALTEFTNNGQFKILPRNQKSNPQTDGELRFSIALVGPAEVVKLTTQLHLNDAPSYVASVSMNIHGMDYHGIYNAFEYVGAEAAKRLNAKMTLPAPASHSATTQADTSSTNSATTTLFNQAQTLKRKGQYHQARAIFEEIAEQPLDNQWTSQAKDELRYGLPMFEADNIMPDNAMGDPGMVLKKMQTVSHLYRQILADNTDNPQRVIDINQRLDQMSISLKHMRNAIKASALSRAMPLRIMLMEHLMMTGSWPEPDQLTQLLGSIGNSYHVVRYEHETERAELVIEEENSNVTLQLKGDMQGISIQALN